MQKKLTKKEVLRLIQFSSPPGGEGVPGPSGPTGPAGEASTVPGPPGYSPVKGVDYFDGDDGSPGTPGSPGAAGLDGAQGPQGDPGPAPAGTGYVHVTGGVLDTPAATATPATHGNTAHSATYITAGDIPAIPAVANASEVADCSTASENDGSSPRYARADHVHKYVDTTGGAAAGGWGLW